MAGEPAVSDLQGLGGLSLRCGNSLCVAIFGQAAHRVHEDRGHGRREGELLPVHPLLRHGKAAVLIGAEHA